MGLFTNKKKKLLAEGVLAPAVLTQVRDTGVTINNNPQVKLIFEVRPDGGESFEASVNQLVSRVNIPQPGMEVFVRYDPADRKKIVIDQQAVADYNAKADVKGEEAQALQVPADLASNGIPARASILDVQPQGKAGDLVNTRVTASLRLVDGTPPYQVSFAAALAPDTVNQLRSGGPIVPMAARVDPANRNRAALSPSEEVPVVPYDNPAALEGPMSALKDGTPATVVPTEIQRQFLRVSSGEEMFSMKARINGGTPALVGAVLVPADARWLFTEGRELPAKMIANDPGKLAIDWDAARRGAGAAA